MEEKAVKKERFTTYIPSHILDELKDASSLTEISQSRLVELALVHFFDTHSIERLSIVKK